MKQGKKRKLNGSDESGKSKMQKLASMSEADVIKSILNDSESDGDNDLQSKNQFRDSIEDDNAKDSSKEEYEQEEDSSDQVQTSESEENEQESDSSSIGMIDSKQHKRSLQKLKESDPDFYKFLEENDKQLLTFSDSESENEEENEEDKVHKPPQELEVASDESDFEADDAEVKDQHVVTLMMVNTLQEKLQGKCSVEDLRTAVQVFHSAFVKVAGVSEEDLKSATFVVDRSAVFNGIMQMCIMDLQPAVMRVLRMPSKSAQLNKCKKWSKVMPVLKMYLKDLTSFLNNVVSSEVLAVLLKHLHQMGTFLPYFSTIRRPLLKQLVKLWGTAEETVRVLAFLCLLRFTSNQMQELYDKVLKMMYLTYIRNCKFVSPSTLPSITFMRLSLVEMFALDGASAYQHVFLYIRQLAIHLRNAIVLHKQECIQTVYNWQYVLSLHLWVELFGKTVQSAHLQPLIYPLVQVIIGTIKLIPTAQYYPLRFHCVQMLIQLSQQTGVFIPILPFLTEVLIDFDFNKHHKKVSMKPLDLTCILRFSKSQLQENGSKDAILQKIYQQLLEYLASEAHNISFPDLVVPTVLQLKKFLKECKSSNYSRTMKQALEKIEENAKFIENERRTVSFSLTDRKAIDAWETNIKLKVTPLAKFFESWNKVHKQKVAKSITENEKLGDYNLPVLKKHNKKDVKVNGPTELFPSSSDEADDDNMECSTSALNIKEKVQRGTRGGKGKNKAYKKTLEDMEINNFSEEDDNDDVHDIVKDMKLSDFD